MNRLSPSDAAWAALALLPQALNTLATSFLVERLVALPLPWLHRLHRARPLLDGLSLLASAELLWRGRALGALPLAAGLKALARLVTAQDAHPAYQGPVTVLDAAGLDARLAPEDPVLGLFLNGEARCYPLSLIRTPAVLHDHVGGEEVAPTWCPMSRAAVALWDNWQGRRLALQAVGAPANDMIFFDPRSRGLISQLRARIMTGPNRGAPLRAFPLTLTNWATWRELHPGTTGLWLETGPQVASINWLLERAEVADARSPRPLYALDQPPDPRLPPKARVLGVYRRGHARAYEREALAMEPVRNEWLGGEPAVVLYDAGHDVAACYSRRQGERVLSFEPGEGPALAVDRETGGRWDVAGRELGGSRRLEPVGLVVDGVYWFAWARCHPQTELAEEVVTIELSRDCAGTRP